ncbi:MAG: hypothetical protein KC468_14225, partial [Myxococcales bacterium]|nr:hypothetical protein [Myxococcales bacterium]
SLPVNGYLFRNAELVGCFRFEVGKEEAHRWIFQDALQVFQDIAIRWPGEALASNLAALVRDVPWIQSSSDGARPTGARLISNLHGTIWDALTEGIVAPVRRLTVLSRFFDARPTVLDTVVNNLAPREVTVYTENGITTLTPGWLEHPLVDDGALEVRLVRYDDDGQPQPLHGKALAITHGGGIDFAYGSANFSAAALLRTPDEGNVETMVVLRGLRPSQLDVDRVLDPAATAMVLEDVEALQFRGHDPRPPATTHALRLLEASLEGEQVHCVFADAGEIGADSLHVELLFYDDARLTLRLRQFDQDHWGVEVKQEVIRRATLGTTIVTAFAYADERELARSGRRILLNLQDIKSGTAQRRSRYVREAEQSAVQFAGVLAELIRLQDESTLITFLTHCDIPISADARVAVHGMRRPPDQDAGLRELGALNLKFFDNLHDATVHFVARHMRRLRRHLGRASLPGAPSFMHVSLAISRVLKSQLDRALSGFEALEHPLRTETWHHYREMVAVYLTQLRELLGVLTEEYVPALESLYDGARVTEALEPDVPSIREICRGVLSVEMRVTAAREHTLRVRIGHRRYVPAPLFQRDLLHSSQWPAYRRAVETASAKLARHGPARA